MLAAALLPSAALGEDQEQLQKRFAEYATRTIDASRITHRQFVGGVNNRLTVVHEMAYENPDRPDGPWNTAVYDPVDRLWVGGIGVGARQSDSGGYSGYKFDAYGLNTGYDWTKGDLTVGIAAAYTFGKIKNNDFDAKNKVETVNFGVYASHDPLSGLFYDMNAGYGMSWNRALSSTIAEGAGYREGRFKATSYGLGGNIGYGFDLRLAKITPTIGFQWTRHKQDGYTEMAGGAATPNWFDEAKNDFIDIPLAVRIGTSWQTAGGAVLSPEVRAAYIYQAGDKRSSVTMGSPGEPGYTFHGVDSGKNRGLVGGGLKANFNATLDAFVDYSLEFRSGYRSTNFNTGVGVSF